jgi:histidine triad (HIT) family protein|tara:strand:+ start:1763 stop:2209 length:447 start_codon:yes stop_codon:yes gene_type:complete
MTQKNCVFCKIIKGEIASYKIFEDNHTIAFLDRFPISLGHTLVIPKVHIERIEELNQKETVALFSTVQKIVGPILHSFDSSSSTIGINDGKDAGQVIPHIHVHIVPRSEGDDGGNIHSIMNKQPTIDEEILAEVAEKICKNFSKKDVI